MLMTVRIQLMRVLYIMRLLDNIGDQVDRGGLIPTGSPENL